MTVDISRRPYHDDYNEDKGFYKILHTPRRPVQVRELNQVQSLYEKQIQRLGNHIFENGSLVIPGELNYDLNYSYVKVNITNLVAVSSLLNKGLRLVSNNGVDAVLDLFVAAEGSDPTTFYVQYKNANNANLKFAIGNTLSIYDANDNLLTTASVLEEGNGSKLTVNRGVYFVNGKFVLNQEQTIIISKYTNTPSVTAGFLYTESIVTEDEDTSLLDNAQGNPNFTAPGAHRLKIDLVLTSYPIIELGSVDENYVEIFRIKDGVVQKKARGPEYNILNDVLAQRTYEESGDYTVKHFPIGLREHLLDDGNRGLYTAEEGGDENKFVVQIESGTAYVRGYRIENLSTVNIEANKARETSILNNSSFSASLGYYIYVENLSRIPNTKDFTTIQFYDDEATIAGSVPSGSVIGSAKIRFLEKDGARYKLYLFDIRDALGNLSTSFLVDAVSIYQTNFTADVVDSVINDVSNNSLVFPLNVSYVKTLENNLGVSDTTFSTVRQFTGTTDASGVITFSASTNETFVSQTADLSFLSYTDTVEFDDVVGNYTLGGSPTGSTITIDLGVGNASRPLVANLRTSREVVVQKTKTSTTTSVSGSLTSGKLSLGKADVYRINSILDDDGNNVTSLFNLVSNKTRSFYDISYVETSSTVVEPVTVNFTYFAHSTGDYFGVDSYSDVEYQDIPVEDGVRLSDVLDFRPRIGDSGTSFTSIGGSTCNIPVPYSIVRTDVEFYLPRIDKVYVDYKGNFGIYEGTPSIAPKEPSDVSEAMVLYTLYIPPYTFSASDINASRRNNKRYTMRDIGKLENRISNVEYYVSLNYLEQEALGKQILDSGTGLNRFKNGIMVDPFVDLKYSDTSWNDFSASVTPIGGGSLRPEVSLNAVDFIQNEAESSGVVVNNNIVTLPFTSTIFIEQTAVSSTINVNPYAVYRWSGDISISPSIDNWFDTIFTEPDVVSNESRTGSVNTNLFGGWQINWSGVDNAINVDQSGNFVSSGASAAILQQSFGTSADVVTGSIITQNTTFSENSEVVSERIINTSVIPFMRPIDISINGIGNRPNAKMSFFFDGVNVNDFITPAGDSLGDDVVTDANGNFNAVFSVPNTSTNRFRTGERLLTVTDREDNNRVLATSFGQATFVSQGTTQTVQRTIVTTRVENTSIDILWIDPIAQSFLVESDGGAFITKIDIFFNTKDDSVPVTVDIREMENGYPTSRVVPGSRKTLLPSEVIVSEDGSEATSFEFSQPIYLNDNTEYCFVVSSNSDNYNIFVAVMGEVDSNTGVAISKQPYAGVMFKSQNSSTWSADQNSDVKFVIHKAVFDIEANGLLYLENDELGSSRLTSNPFTSTSGESEIVVYKKNHNYIVGGTVEISGATTGNGISAVTLNDTFEVVSILSKDEFVIDVVTNATSSGSFGGSNVDISNTIQASILSPNISNIKLPNTNIVVEMKGTNGKSVSGDETPYQQQSSWVTLTNKENYELTQPWVITSGVDETENVGGNKSIAMKVTLTSTNPNISPVVDIDSCSVITPFYLVNYEEPLEVDGSNNYTNNRTLPITLSQPAESLKVFLEISRPQGSDVIVLARFGSSLEEMNSAAFQQLNNVNALATSGRGIFVDQEFGLDDLSPFAVFQVMIQIKSNSAALIPVVRKLRCIALGT